MINKETLKLLNPSIKCKRVLFNCVVADFSKFYYYSLAQQSSENHSERIEQLRTQTEIARNGIFVLPVMPDHLSGYIQRLQNLLLERFFRSFKIEGVMSIRVENRCQIRFTTVLNSKNPL